MEWALYRGNDREQKDRRARCFPFLSVSYALDESDRMGSSPFPTVRISDLSDIIQMEENGGGEKKSCYIYMIVGKISQQFC